MVSRTPKRTPRTPRAEPAPAPERRLGVSPAEFARRDAWRRERLMSIFDCPEEILPDGIPQLLLCALAHWFDVRVYASGGAATGTWCIWLEQLAEVRASHDGRVTVAEWRRTYPALLAEIGYDTRDAPVPHGMTEETEGTEAPQ